ncbi:MAG: hypothetical protein VX910_12180 [Candidatus Latescibacterota bacterium]|nr:hypothetical protein [Candidatus Latescibacterota bacterium]
MPHLKQTLIVLLFLTGCATGTTWIKPDTNFNSVRSVSVIPLLSNKPGLGDEIANRITTALLQLNRFEVIASDFVEEHKEGGQKDRAENVLGESSADPEISLSSQSMAESLKVDAILTGSVRRYGNWFIGKNMSINAKMVSRSGSIIWTCNYKTDRALMILRTEGELASKIVKEVVGRLQNSL